MPDRDAPETIRRLAERLAEEATKEGLTLRGFSFLPMIQGNGPHLVQAMFSVNDEPEPTDEEQAKFDKQFEEMMFGAETKKAEIDKRIETVRDDVKKRMQEGKGILDED